VRRQFPSKSANKRKNLPNCSKCLLTGKSFTLTPRKAPKGQGSWITHPRAVPSCMPLKAPSVASRGTLGASKRFLTVVPSQPSFHPDVPDWPSTPPNCSDKGSITHLTMRTGRRLQRWPVTCVFRKMGTISRQKSVSCTDLLLFRAGRHSGVGAARIVGIVFRGFFRGVEDHTDNLSVPQFFAGSLRRFGRS
jgi:hypothetical protein